MSMPKLKLGAGYTLTPLAPKKLSSIISWGQRPAGPRSGPAGFSPARGARAGQIPPAAEPPGDLAK